MHYYFMCLIYYYSVYLHHASSADWVDRIYSSVKYTTSEIYRPNKIRLCLISLHLLGTQKCREHLPYNCCLKKVYAFTLLTRR